jgi:hypothetical protein
MRFVSALLIAMLSSQMRAQNEQQPNSTTTTAIEIKVVSALSFEQGDLGSFRRAQANFTPKGWDEFMKTMQGFLDSNGVPTFTSKFVPAGGTVVVSQEQSAVKAKIPGTLTQTQGNSRATYRLRVEVQLAGSPPKIDHLEQITCLGAAAAKYCM